MTGDHLFQLLRSYDPSDVSMQEFYALWREGISAEEAVAVLGGDTATGTPDRFGEWGSGSDGSGEQAGGLLVGAFSGWTVLIGDHRCVGDEAAIKLSRQNRRALALEWDFHGECRLKYARSGELITILDVLDIDYRSGSDPDALDPYLEGLRFSLDEEPAVEPAESFTSALTAIGRVVGRQINRDWLDSPHTSYAIPADDSM
ncbi:DUF6461 domain-containing protein [Rhizohabitans arisaemae]|uniref:DUF6461 domain-containing protein n=1 Tax=Rhizohabitans arisaemae TaxID=2720610 RepID=UPI0024B23181|nr:DUF6461 domain-containing protein [Rhizohabitans arisaemae]